MATNPNTTEPADRNPFMAVVELACQAREQSTRAAYLARAIDSVAEEIVSLEPSDWRRVMAAVDRIMVFSRMAEEASAAAGDAAGKMHEAIRD